MMPLLGSWSSPPLPDGFAESLHERLVNEGQDQPLVEMPECAVARPLWASALWAGGLMAAGAAAVLLILWVGVSPAPRPPVRCPAPGQVQRARVVTPNAAIVTNPPDSARRLRVGQVAVLVLSIRAESRHTDARLLVVLPDGVTLLGEGAKALEEKRMEWTASLNRGDNEIRIPVRAQRVGTWRLVARARAAGFRTVSEARLVVTRS